MVIDKRGKRKDWFEVQKKSRCYMVWIFFSFLPFFVFSFFFTFPFLSFSLLSPPSSITPSLLSLSSFLCFLPFSFFNVVGRKGRRTPPVHCKDRGLYIWSSELSKSFLRNFPFWTDDGQKTEGTLREDGPYPSVSTSSAVERDFVIHTFTCGTRSGMGCGTRCLPTCSTVAVPWG